MTFTRLSELPMFRAAFLAAMLAGVQAVPAAAQQAGTPPPVTPSESNAGVGPRNVNPAQLDKGQNNHVYSGGASTNSAAPNMNFDCKGRPGDCTDPLTSSDIRTKPQVPLSDPK